MKLTKSPTRIVIADEHTCFRKGLKHVLTRRAGNAIKVVAGAKDGEDLLRSVKNHRPEVVLSDVRIPRLSGVEAGKEVSNAYPTVDVIGISYVDEPGWIYQMQETGVSKAASPAEMTAAAQAVLRGQTYYCHHASRILVRLIAPDKRNDFNPSARVSLSQKEIAVIKLICRQLTTLEIAEELHLSVKSVENYSKQIKAKTEAKNIVGIVLFAVKNGYVSSYEL